MDTEVTKAQARIEAVELEIKHAESAYDAVLLAEPCSSEAASTAERKQFLRERLSYLREKEKHLWEEKTDKEKHLREKEMEKERHLREKERHLREKEMEKEKYIREKEMEKERYLREKEMEKEKDLREKEKHLREKELVELKLKLGPPGDVVMSKLERIETGMYATMWSHFWGELSSTVTSETTEQFRTELVSYYGDATDKINVAVPEKTLRCMVTDLRLPGKWITAAHLLARKDEGKAHVFGIRNISHPQNGLLWFRAFEEAFTMFRIAFSWDADANTLLLHILDASLCNQKISEVELRKKVNRSLDHFMDVDTKRQFESLTFGDLEGKSITFNNLNRPYKRVLSLHAKLGIHKAKLGGILPPCLDLDKFNFDYWTEAADTKVLNTFLKDSQLWIDGKGIFEDGEAGEVDLQSAASAD